MKKLFAGGLLSTILLLTACSKDDTNPTSTSGIEGSYNFKYMSAKTNSTLTGSTPIKSVTISDYTTIDNAGSIKLNNGSLTAEGLTYSVNSQAESYTYNGSTLIDSSSFPFKFKVPTSNSTGQYKIIGSDSIYFPKGGLTVPSDGSGPYQGQASGGHFSLKGKLLTIVQNVARDSSFKTCGETFRQIESATVSIVLEKQ